MSDNYVSSKDAFISIGFIFGGMFGVLLCVISIFWVFDTVLYSTAYTQYDGVVVDASDVESYTSTTTRKYKSTTGKYKSKTEKTTRYRQDIIVAYNNTESSIKDVSVEREGYSLNDEVSIYVSNSNPNDVTVHADVSDVSSSWGIVVFLVIYWVVYISLAKRTAHKLKNNN